MLKSILQKNKLNFLGAGLLVLLLIAVRFFESKFFYDPFLPFFKGDFFLKPIPELNNWLLLTSFLIRFTINSLLSIAIIYCLFLDIKYIKFLSMVYLVLFVVLVIGFYFFLYVYFIDWQVVFYIRRFLIQPLFLIFFIPALLFQRVSQGAASLKS